MGVQRQALGAVIGQHLLGRRHLGEVYFGRVRETHHVLVFRFTRLCLVRFTHPTGWIDRIEQRQLFLILAQGVPKGLAAI